MNNIRAFVGIVAMALASVTPWHADAAKKYIFTSWELGERNPQEVLKMADLFDRTACDGVGLKISGALPGYSVVNPRHVTEDTGWKYEEVAHFEPVFRDIVKHPSLRESMLLVDVAPRKRLNWKDDRAWAAFANNMGIQARLAKRGGLKGLITDVEDYHHQYQYIYADSDGDSYAAHCRLARKRGREVFGPVFAEYPDIVILTFQLLTGDVGYVTADPVAWMLEQQDLWPAFVNGILDVMPPEAKLVDGNESLGYHCEAHKNDFPASAAGILVKVLPVVARENRAKYRSQVQASFGLYMDSYSCTTNSGWYKGPARGKRINRFEDNLRQATEYTDEYVWFWGEMGYWIDWPTSICNWGCKTWDGTFDGPFDLMARGVKDPVRCAREEYAKQKAAGTFQDLVGALPEANEKGHIAHRVWNCETDGWYGVRSVGRGRAVSGQVYLQQGGNWRYDLGGAKLAYGPADADGWREGWTIMRIPEGADQMWIVLDGRLRQDNVPVEVREFEVFRIK